jgi:uncharacterized membrane protein
LTSLYFLNVTVHVLAALLWLGGMLFLAVVGAPVLRHVQPDSLRALIFRQLGTAFRRAGWISVGILLVTGTLNLAFRGWLRWEVLLEPAFWGSGPGRTLAWKLAAVTVMLVTQAVHDFWHGPRASRTEPGSPEALRFRRQAALFARLNAVVALILVYVSVRLARGG